MTDDGMKKSIAGEFRLNSRRRNERGNIFFTLFGAVALIGVIGAASTALMRGPLSTVVTVNQRAKADTQMQLAAKLAIVEVAQEANDGDCDADGFVEPYPFKDAGADPHPNGGGWIPDDVGATKVDPWGTEYGYCVWDSGPLIGDAACGGGVGHLAGTNAANQPVLAIVSAGPDRTFDTECNAWADTAPADGLPDDPLVDMPSGADDVIIAYTYDEAAMNSGGLWSLKTGDPSIATIDKGIEVQGTAQFQSEADFQGGARLSSGGWLDLSAGGLLDLPDEAAVATCNVANDGVLRIFKNLPTDDARVLQICSAPTSGIPPAAWVDVGGAGAAALTIDDLDDAVADASNLFLGDGGGEALSSGANNVGVGIGAGELLNTGSGNVLLGRDAGNILTSGDNNIIIGNNQDAPANNSTGYMNIGGLLYGDLTAGEIGIGTDTPSTKLDVSGTVNADRYQIGANIFYDNGGGGELLLGTGGSTRVTIDATGRVGVGMAPSEELDVAGDMRASDDAYADSFYGELGSAGVATFSFGGDATTGIFSPGAGAVGVTTGGTQRMVIDGTGVGIGDPSPSEALDVVGNGLFSGYVAGQSFRVDADTGLYDSGGGLALNVGGSAAVSILGTGEVGIGVASPGMQLAVAGGVQVGDTVTACGAGLAGSIKYDSSGDALSYCSSDGNWYDIGAAGGGGGGAASFWTKLGDDRLYYIDNFVGVGTNDPLARFHVANGDFLVVGADGSAASMPVTGAGTRMVFDNASGAFRVGTANGTQWDDANVGQNSIGIGHSVTAAGLRSHAIGNFVVANAGATDSMAFGYDANVTGQRALSFGAGNQSGGANPDVTGNESMGFFLGDNSGALVSAPLAVGYFMGDQTGVNLATTKTFLIAGGSLMIDPNAPATELVADYPLTVDVEGAVGAIQYCDETGGDCFTAADVSGGALGAPGSDTQVIYNSGGNLGADANFIWDRTTSRLGLGGVAPVGRIHTSDLIYDSAVCPAGYVAGDFDLEADTQDCLATGLVVLADGSVGVGTATPNLSSATRALTLSANTTGGMAMMELQGNVTADGFSSGVGFFNDTTNIATVQANRDGANNSGALLFGTASGGSMAEAMRVTSTGDIIIAGGGATAADLTLRLDVNGQVGATEYCDEDGLNCVDISSLSNGTLAAGSDREIQFNSNGIMGADPKFVFTSTGAFIVGSNQMDDTGTGSEDNRMFFDAATAAFRAGGAFATEWDAANVGYGSAAFGEANTASGDYSAAFGSMNFSSGSYSFVSGDSSQVGGYAGVAMGFNVESQGNTSVAMGATVRALGANSTALGREATTQGNSSFAIGLTASNVVTDPVVSASESLGIFMGPQSGVNLATANTMGLFGGSMVIDPKIPATNLSADTAFEVDGTIKFAYSGEACDAAREGSVRYMSSTDKYQVCALAANGWQDIAVGSLITAGGANTNVQFNSNGVLGGESDFSWDPATDVLSVTGQVSVTDRVNFAPQAADPPVGFALNDLDDVDTAGVLTGNTIVFDGTDWVVGTVGSGSVGAAGGDREVQFNSGGFLAADANFVYSSVGDFIVGSPTKSYDGSNATRMFFDKAKGAFRVGYEDGAQWTTIGDYSVAMGRWTTASGSSSIALGEGATASGLRSYAIGRTTNASNSESVAIGHSSISSGIAAIAIGESAEASGQYSLAFGRHSDATAENSMAFGYFSDAFGQYSMAFGYNSLASGISSFAFGNATAGNGTGGSGFGDGSMSIGLQDDAVAITAKPQTTGIQSMGIFMGDQDGVVFSSNNTMGLFGGSMVIDPKIPATNLSADTAFEVDGTIKFAYSGEACDVDREGSVRYMSSTDKYQVCALAANGWQDIAIGSAITAGGVNTNVQFNSNGELGGEADFSWDPTTNVLDVNGSINVADRVNIAGQAGNAPVGIELNDLDDVDTAGVLTGNTIVFDGTDWVVGTVGSGSVGAAGNDREVQFNSGGTLAGAGSLYYGSEGWLGINVTTRNYDQLLSAEQTYTSVAAGKSATTSFSVVHTPSGNEPLGDWYNTGRLTTAVEAYAEIPAGVTNRTNKTVGAGIGAGVYGDGQVIDLIGGDLYVGTEGGAAVTTMTSMKAFSYGGGTGTITNLIGADVNTMTWDTVATTNMYGIKVTNSMWDSATATNRYGVYIDNIGGTAATNDFGFYQVGTQRNYLGGSLGIGTAAGVANTRLDVNGTIKMGYSGEACDATREGGIRYMSNTDVFEVCATTAEGWTEIGGNVRIVSGGAPVSNFVENLNDLGDVTITAAANGECLVFNGTAWVDGPCTMSAPSAAGNDRELQFNSGGAFAADAALAYTSGGVLQVGSPSSLLPVPGISTDGTIHSDTVIYVGADLLGGGVGTAVLANGINSMIDPQPIGDDVDISYTIMNPNNNAGVTMTREFLNSADAVDEDFSITNYPGGVATPLALIFDDNRNFHMTRQAGFTETNPPVFLTVDGTIKIDYTGEACDASREGSIRYMSNTDKYQVCATTANGWQDLAVGSGSVGASGADTNVQFNSGGTLGGEADFTWNSATNILGVTGSVNVTNRVNIAPQAAATPDFINLNDLSDVTIAAAANGECLVFNGTAWVDGPCTASAAGGDRELQFNSNGSFSTDPGLVLTAAGLLGVDGTLRFAYSGEACDATNEGSIRYMSSTDKYQVCATTANGWQDIAIGSAITAGGADTNIQFNSGGELGGEADFAWDATTNVLDVNGSVNVLTHVNIAGQAGNAPNGMDLDGLTDVDTSGVATGDTIVFDGANWTIGTVGSGSVAAAGSDRQVQFNSGGSFAADALFVYTSAGDFIVGSPQISDTGNAAHDTRMFFHKAQNAFRVGTVTGTQWDLANIGYSSIAMGYNNTVAADSSMAVGDNNNIPTGGYANFAFGDSNTVEGDGGGGSSFAAGYANVVDAPAWGGMILGLSNTITGDSDATGIIGGWNNATTAKYGFVAGYDNDIFGESSKAIGSLLYSSGFSTTAIGYDASVTGNYSTVFGMGDPTGTKPVISGTSSFGVFMGNQGNVAVTASNNFGVFGGSMVIDPKAPATNLSADTALEVEGTLKISYGGEACDAAREGGIRYISATDAFEFCASTADGWSELTASVETVSGDPPVDAFVEVLDDLTDVTITAAANGQCLVYDGAVWENGSCAGGGGTTPAGADTQIQYNSGGLMFASAGLTFTGGNQLNVAGNLGLGTDSIIYLGAEPFISGSDADGNIIIAMADYGGNAHALTGTGNTVLGQSAGESLVGAGSNTLIGYAAGFTMENSGSNVLVGAGSGTYLEDVQWNVAIGNGTLQYASQTYSTTAIGYAAGQRADGDGGIFIGFGVGSDLYTEGDRNIIIGYESESISSNINDWMNIGDTIFGDLAAKRIRIGSQAIPVTRFEVDGTIKIAFSGEACDAAHEGAIRYMSNTDKYQVCATTASGWQDLAVGSGSVGASGANTNIQFNSNGTLGGEADFTWNATTNVLAVTGAINVSDRINIAAQAGNAPDRMAIGDLLDVDTTGAANGDSLIFDGTSWAPGTASAGGGGALDDLSDVSVTYSSGNMFLGQNAGAVTTSSSSTVLGADAYVLNTTGDKNVAVGRYTLADNVSGLSNVAIGYKALEKNTASDNTAVGTWALSKTTSGTQNTSMGRSSMRENLTGRDNVAIGYNALYTATDADANVAIGKDALELNALSDGNTAVGYKALSVATGANNTALGNNAGLTTTTGAGNILIGNAANASAATSSNELNIGNTIYGDLATDRVGIGQVPAAGVELDVLGDIQYTGTITDISDMRLKKDIVELDAADILARLDRVDTYSFRMIGDETGRLELGVMAQEVEKVFPELVRTADDAMKTKSVNYVGFVAPLIEASKTLKAENESLKAELASVKADQANMMASIDDLRNDMNGMKAHTGYGINKAQIGLWMLAGMAGTLLVLLGGGWLRRRRSA